jgi:ribosomal protein S18 acetylase RimI-like enzyme
MMTIEIREMLITDYDAALALWKRCAGMGLSEADEREPMAGFLARNPSLNFIARDDDRLIGTILCGSDGRRGYLYHLAVDPLYRRQGIAGELVRKVFDALHKLEIDKCHIMVYAANESGLAFWQQDGWVTRPEIVLMSKNVGCQKGNSAC